MEQRLRPVADGPTGGVSDQTRCVLAGTQRACRQAQRGAPEAFTLLLVQTHEDAVVVGTSGAS